MQKSDDHVSASERHDNHLERIHLGFLSGSPHRISSPVHAGYGAGLLSPAKRVAVTSHEARIGLPGGFAEGLSAPEAQPYITKNWGTSRTRDQSGIT